MCVCYGVYVCMDLCSVPYIVKRVKVMLYLVRFVDSVQYDLWAGDTMNNTLRSYALTLPVLTVALVPLCALGELNTPIHALTN